MGRGAELTREIESRIDRKAPPPAAELAEDMAAACEVLEGEAPERRPRDDADRSGGVIRLLPDIPTVVLPDIHARIDLLVKAMITSFPEHGIEDPLLMAIDAGRAQLVMVGDYVHGEARVRDRWAAAYGEFLDGYRRREAMDAEMYESLTSLQIVSLLKRAYPEHVHGLKGNHENIANEEGNGNHAFGKFANEGAIVADYMDRFYAGEAFDGVYRFEHDLPLLAVGESFVVTHAEPLEFFTFDEIRTYRDRPEVVEGLTWTDNGAAAPGSVAETVAHMLPEVPSQDAIHLGGHRPVSGLYALRAEGQYVQFHNPGRLIAALPPRTRSFDPESDIVEL